jgi:glutaredoxin
MTDNASPLETRRNVPPRWRQALALAWLVAGALWLAAAPAATGGAVDVYAFVADGCPHCEKALAFLERDAARHAGVRVHALEITRSARNADVLAAVARALGADDSAVPFIVIGEHAFIGYLDDRSTGAALRAQIDECLAHGCADIVGPHLRAATLPEGSSPARPPSVVRALPETIHVPLVGDVTLRSLSLPALTVLLAALDGFNPCAMWTLVFLIGLLLGMQDRVRMWTLGAAFIAASALVYFLFMVAWLNLLLFLRGVVWVRAAIGAVAVAGGLYHLREYVLNRQAACKVTAPQSRRAVFERLRSLASERRFLVAVGGIVLLAFAVNLVEAVCSAGIPAVYTQVLAMSGLSQPAYYAYLSLYIAVFMLDDLIVFVAAMKTLHFAGIGTRYARASNLVGGMLLLALGALLLLRPEWLMVG